MSSVNKRLMITSAVASAVAVASIAYAENQEASQKKSAQEKCYGLAKAGKNDCHGAGAVSCAGSGKERQGFIFMPKGLCERLIGGSLTEPKEDSKQELKTESDSQKK